ncbi:hypothetical protein [Kitasatospora sp. NPDC093806]|uniref:hypothetical protein n=1 Tax=Kitasatospora sp. NPDC093806 TaxID=3155075 RepID=UPI003428E396
MNGAAVGVRLLWLLVAVLFSVVIGLLTFILRIRIGSRAAEAALLAGSAFGGSMLVALGLLAFAFGG